MTATSTALTPALLDLMEHEKEIDQHLEAIDQHIEAIGWCLTQIRDGRKYRAKGYDTFEEYVSGRWGKNPAWAYRQIAAAEIIEILSPNGDTQPGELAPTSEGQVRPLAPLRDDPEALKAAWDAAVEDADGEQPTANEVAEAVKRVREPQPLRKPDRGGAPHPAVFSDPLLPVIAELLTGWTRVLDPFAGTGRIHELSEDGWDTVGIEIEPEWATMHPRTQVGNALALDFDDESFDAIATSPTYGNRFADSYEAADPEARRSYRFDLGRELNPDNSGSLQWGPKYQAFHERAWSEALRVLRPGGRFVLNVKDHIRDGRWVDVTGWHVNVLTGLGLRVAAVRAVPIGSFMLGANADRRAAAELVIALDKP